MMNTSAVKFTIGIYSMIVDNYIHCVMKLLCMFTLHIIVEIIFRVGNLDTRIPNPDHGLTEDISEFTTSVAHLYSHIAKPLLDLLLISVTLVRRGRSIGSNMFIGPALTLSVIGLTGQILKCLSPRFGQLVAVEADLKAKLRHKHSRIVTNSEEIAFYGGGLVEKKVLQDAYAQECSQSKKIYFAKWWYVFFEQFLMKYVWAGTGMVVTAIPILTGKDYIFCFS
jgi:ATP-binding cassette subfamily D (ALD) protein 2